MFEEDTPLELIRRVRPTVLVKGGDYRARQVVGHEVVEADGGEVVLVDLVPGHSTTADRAALRRRRSGRHAPQGAGQKLSVGFPMTPKSSMAGLDHEALLRRAFAVARRSRENGDHPFGALLAGPDGEVLREQCNGYSAEGAT